MDAEAGQYLNEVIEGDSFSMIENQGDEKILSFVNITAANRFFHLGDDKLAGLLGAAAALRGIEVAEPLLESFHRLFFHMGTDIDQAANLWIEEGACLKDLRAAAGALLIMSGITHMMQFYHERNISDAVLQDSLKDFSIWMDDYYEKTGQTGLEQVSWLLLSMRGLVIRLGRLQFMLQPLKLNLAVALNHRNGLATAFFPMPESLREDGQIAGTNGIYPATTYESFFSTNEDSLEGTPIHPGGYGMRYPVRLPKSDWEIAALPGSGSIDIHIPKDGKMGFSQCQASLHAAAAFFPKHFPEKPFRLFTLCTWFLDAQLQSLLSKDSNIVRLQKEFYLLPVLSDEHASYERVFGSSTIDMAGAPDDTTLRRVIKQFVLADGRMRYNAGFILPEDLGLFGGEHYRTTSASFIENSTRREAMNGPVKT